MIPHNNDFEELGRKVQRAEQALEQIQGVGIVNRIRVVVDARGRLLSVTVDEEDIILAAYRAAVADIQPRIDEALSELRADSRLDAVSTFADANSAWQNAERLQHVQEYEDDDYYEQRNRHGWFENG
jgi:hypothetical protein